MPRGKGRSSGGFGSSSRSGHSGHFPSAPRPSVPDRRTEPAPVQTTPKEMSFSQHVASTAIGYYIGGIMSRMFGFGSGSYPSWPSTDGTNSSVRSGNWALAPVR